MNDLANGNAARRRCFLCDKLASHRIPLVRGAVLESGHSLMFCPPYAPWIAPIEYVFNVIQHQLSVHVHGITRIAQLRTTIDRIVLDMGSFVLYYLHCAYHF